MEEFIKKHRGEFDDQHPSSNVWAGVQYELNQPKIRRLSSWRKWSVAASFLLLLAVTGVMAYYYGVSQGQHQSELVELQNFYQNKLEQQLDKLSDRPEVVQVKNDILNASPKFSENKGLSQKAKEAQLKVIIQNFEQRIETIEKIIEQQNRIENENI